MKLRLLPYTTPKVSTGKEWFIYYRYQRPQSDPLFPAYKLFKERLGLNTMPDLRERRRTADQFARDLHLRLKNGWSPFGYTGHDTPEYDHLKHLPVAHVLTNLLQTKKTTVRHRSYQAYKYSINILQRYIAQNHLTHLSIEHFTHNNARAFADHLLLTGRYRNKSFNSLIGYLRSMFNLALDRELITKNPFAKIKFLPVEIGKNFPFTPQQKADIKQAILQHDPALWPFVKCIYHLFTRRLELLQIRIADIDLQNHQIIIHSSVGKNKRQLPVAIPDAFLPDVLSWNLPQYPPHYYLFGPHLLPGPKPYHYNTVTARHRRILDLLHLPTKYNLYSWKHTGNIDAVAAGIDAYDIMRQNRHHSLEQTMIYLRSMGLRPNINFSKKGPAL